MTLVRLLVAENGSEICFCDKKKNTKLTVTKATDRNDRLTFSLHPLFGNVDQ